MEATLGSMFAEAVRRYGAKTAVVSPDRTLSYMSFGAAVERFSHVLAEWGIGQGDVVTLWMENGWRWMVAYYAALRRGAAVNPCNILLTAEEVAFMATDCHAKLLIVAREKAGSIRSRVQGRTITDHDLATLCEPGPKPATGRTSDAVEIRGTDVSTIGYTSGTTGHPKGAMLTHRSIVLNTAMTALMHGRRDSDIVVSALPCTHVYGNVVMNAAIACGSTLVLLPRFEEESLLSAIAKHGATVLDGVPTMYMRLLNFAGLDAHELSSLRLCTVGGQTMPVAKMEEVERRFNCALRELWGMTELGGLGTTHPHNGPRRLGSIGLPLPGLKAKVVSLEDATREVQTNEIGELMVRGPLVMKGYLGNEKATRETIESDGWLHTGDLVRQDDEGYLYVVDRAKEVIISGGYNVYPAEVERIIAQHPSVAMVAVAAMHDESRGQVPKAFIVPKLGMHCSAREIIEHCRPHLASYKLPRDIALLEELPKTSTGKILRRALTASKL